MQNKRGKINFFGQSHKGQVTIFIILAIIILGAVITFFVIRQNLVIQTIPESIQPVYTSFLSCIEDKTSVGIDLLESQAGYIELPNFEPGSAYMPFSSQLNFLGSPIPYWSYVSGNNIQKEQVPTQQEMQTSLATFLNSKIRECNFETYYTDGFEINLGEPKTTITIKNNDVAVNLNMDFQVTKGEDTVLVQNHQATVKSNLGALYASAKTVYEKEQKELFLENYGIDTLRLYAPVDGVELTCSPKTWNADSVFTELQEAIETNTLALTTQSPSTKEAKYFFVDTGTSYDVRFINSRSWANSFEVLPSQESLLIATPVGNQQGLGVLGFCYVPYHFVYNVNYPVLVQVYNGDEVFQFPVAVVIQGNKPRAALNSTAKSIESDLCPYKNTPTTVETYDSNLNSIDASISYECFGDTCDIGTTSSGILTADFPQCVNGYVVAKAEGFRDARYLYSTSSEGSAVVILDKLYSLDVNLKSDSANYNGNALIYFNSEGNSKVVSYPEQKSVDLSEGQYEISVYIYKNSSIQLQETTSQQCVDVASSGIGGILGMTEKKCFDVTIPSQVVSNVLAGGGKFDSYFLEDDLKSSDALEINAKGFSTPKTIQELQDNYLIFEDTALEVNLK